MTSGINRIVIIGAGQAGSSVAATLRSSGYGGAISLIGGEPVPPYQRPPLSKAFLKDEIGFDGLRLRSDSFLGDQKIDFRPGVMAERIDRDARMVKLADGTSEPYDVLVIATGSRPRLLAGIDEISAMCGGNCSCATCHVYVDAAGSLPAPAIEESEMLDTLVHQASLSRLACQVALSAGISSLWVEVAPEE